MEHEPSSSSHGPWHEEPAGETATSSTAPEERGVIRVSLSPSVSVSRELFPCGLEPPDTEANEEEPPTPPGGDTAEHTVHPVSYHEPPGVPSAYSGNPAAHNLK